MITWQKHGAALVGAVSLSDGGAAKVVLVAGRTNPKGAVIISGEDRGSQAPLSACLNRLTAEQVVDIICMQERTFGQLSDAAS